MWILDLIINENISFIATNKKTTTEQKENGKILEQQRVEYGLNGKLKKSSGKF